MVKMGKAVRILFVCLLPISFFSCSNGSTDSDSDLILETDYEPTELSGLPIIKIDTGDRSINSKEIWMESNVYTLYDPLGNLILSGITDIKGRGTFTWDMGPKKPYSLKLSEKTALIDMPKHKRWNLLANFFDKTLLKNELTFELGYIFDNMKWTPRSQQVDLYLNGKYRGVYQLTEAIKIDSNRVDIKDISNKNPDRGYILELNVSEQDESFYFTTSRGYIFLCSDPDEDLEGLIEKIKSDVQTAEDALYSSGFKDIDTGYRKYFDIGSFIDWWLVEEISKNFEVNYLHGQYMYYDNNQQKYCMGPLWDFDSAFGINSAFNSDKAEGFLTIGNELVGPYGKRIKWWIDRMFEDPAFVSQVKNRWNEKRSELINILQVLDMRAAYLQKAARQNFLKWNYMPDTSYNQAVARVRAWLSARLQWMDGAIQSL